MAGAASGGTGRRGVSARSAGCGCPGRAGGFDALVPAPRQCAPRTDAQVVELAVGLKKENPARTAAQVRLWGARSLHAM